MTRDSGGYADRVIGELVLAEMRVRQAAYAERAERHRAQQRTANPAGVRSLELARMVKHCQKMADDYAYAITWAEGRTSSDG